MNYSRKYINFINGRYAGEGVRITAGILLPSFLMNHFDLLPIGFVISLGALSVSVADTPGAVRHRVNGMLASCALVTILSLMVNYATVNEVLLGALIVGSGFFFSMLTIYGNRSASVGLAALLIMILSLQTAHKGIEIWLNAAYILSGGVWYMLYSLTLYRLRPYKFIQQVLADYIAAIADYLKLRGELYALNPNYDKVNEELLQQQIHIEAQQHMLSDLLFNTRTIVKESTPTGRGLVKTYLEVSDLYESVMTTYQQYPLLHEQFDNTGILQRYHDIIFSLSLEMQEIGSAVKVGVTSEPKTEIQEQLSHARDQFEQLRISFMNEDNVEDFVGLGRIMGNLEHMSEKISQLHLFTSYEVRQQQDGLPNRRLKRLIPTDDIRPSLFLNNLHLKSNIFRHAVRVALALLVGYVVSLFFKVDHGYWILLTVVVILKPAYALTKVRNSDRLIGTLVGIIIGIAVLFFIKNGTVLLVLMIFFMAGSFMFIRTNYFMTVLLMTTYLLIFFHYLYPGNINQIMLERITDTAIGSVIAFFASLFLVPAWEKNSIRSYMVKMLEVNTAYYRNIARHFAANLPIDSESIKKDRRTVLIALANMSDAFTRMISEPKRFQQGIKHIHRFVSVNHSIIAHLSSLSYLLQKEENAFRSPLINEVVLQTELHFHNAVHVLLMTHAQVQKNDSIAIAAMNHQVQALVDKRKAEIAAGALETDTKSELVKTKSVTDQFNFIHGNASVIYKICCEYEAEMRNEN